MPSCRHNWAAARRVYLVEKRKEIIKGKNSVKVVEIDQLDKNRLKRNQNVYGLVWWI